uniref:CAZy families GT25 protein n=1 Tax=uncultured Ethanoligenens sp. TaxID=286556 RepID=A0A060C9I2_9FIRM|nr:CAZy families GT25 protein [uncultured Ethanoligenens sp.]
MPKKCQISSMRKKLFLIILLADQLYVDPQPKILPDKFDLDVPIKMSNAEIAVALSHINVIRLIAEGPDEYALVLEDDVYFERDFAKTLDAAWFEMIQATDLHLILISYICHLKRL